MNLLIYIIDMYMKNWYLYGAMALSLIILLLVVFISPVAQFLSLQMPNKKEWLVIIALSLVPLAVVELYKMLVNIRCINKKNEV